MVDSGALELCQSAGNFESRWRPLAVCHTVWQAHVGLHAPASGGGFSDTIQLSTACGARAPRMHSIMSMQLAGSPAFAMCTASRPADSESDDAASALCSSHVLTWEHLDARFPSEYAGLGETFLRTQQTHTNM
jgi:hypothetical protein